jgi:hypothetical protein
MHLDNSSWPTSLSLTPSRSKKSETVSHGNISSGASIAVSLYNLSIASLYDLSTSEDEIRYLAAIAPKEFPFF